MDKQKFQAAYDTYQQHRKPFEVEEIDEYKSLWATMIHNAEPEHKYIPRTEFMTDWAVCACGWQSDRFWDGVDLAQAQWKDHVAQECKDDTVEPQTALSMDTRKSLQADLLEVFRRYELSVAVGINAKGVMVGSQDERVDAKNIGIPVAQECQS